MKKLNFVGMLLAVSLFSIGFFSCGNDDDDKNIGNIPEKLIGTWYMSENSFVTFNANGTGSFTTDDEDLSVAALKNRSITRATTTFAFTYQYNETTKEITLSIEGEKAVWTIVNLTDDVLEVKDEEGDIIQFTSSIMPNPDPVNPTELYGDWGYAGKKYMSFVKEGDNSICVFYAENGNEEGRVKFKYENNKIVFYENGEWWYDSAYIVTALTNDYISFNILSEGVVDESMFLFRLQNEPNIIGPISYLHQTWTTFSNDDSRLSEIKITFKDNGKGTFTEDGETISFTYTYNESTHKLTLSIDKEKEVWEITKLTQKTVYFKATDEEDGSTYVMEYRVLN